MNPFAFSSANDTVLFVLICSLLIAIALLVLACLGRRRPRGKHKYLPKQLLTPNEKEFFGRLRKAVPEYAIQSQVCMGALMDGRHSSGKHLRTRAKFSQKIVDYALLDDKLNVILLIELDDRTHDPIKDAARDAMTNEAGYRTLRIESRAKPSVMDLRAQILKAIKKARRQSSRRALLQSA
jgi:very-short-patch-repair endonuclease